HAQTMLAHTAEWLNQRGWQGRVLRAQGRRRLGRTESIAEGRGRSGGSRTDRPPASDPAGLSSQVATALITGQAIRSSQQAISLVTSSISVGPVKRCPAAQITSTIMRTSSASVT